MSAISRCSRIPCILRRANTISRGSSALTGPKWKTISNGIHQPKKLLRTISHQPVFERCYSVSAKQTDDESKTTRKGVTAYSENYPASPFWKAYDFKKEWGTNYNFNHFCHLTYSHFSSKRDYPAHAFYAFMSLVDKKETFDLEEMMMVAKSVSYTNKMLTPEEKIKWLNYFTDKFSSLGLELECSFFNLIMNIYLLHWIPFSPVEFLAKMEKFGSTPNGMTLERFIMAYCRNGDVKSATQVLEHMKACKFPLSNKGYASLVYGNFVAGDKETGMALFRDTVGVGFELDGFAYLNVLLGHAYTGDLNGVKQMIDEMKDNGVILNSYLLCHMAVRVLEYGQIEIFNHIVELLRETGGNFFNDAGTFLPEMCLKGKYDLAYKFFLTLNSPTATLFYKAALFAGMPMEELIQFSRQMKSDGVIDAGLDRYYSLAIQKGCYEKAVEVLPHAVKEGVAMRTQDFWPLIRYFTISRDLEGLKTILPYVKFDSGTTAYLTPSMTSFGVSVKQFSQMVKEHMDLTEAQKNGCILNYCLRTDGLDAAFKLASKFKCVADVTDARLLVSSHLLSNLTKENWEQTSDLVLRFDNLPSRYVEDLLTQVVGFGVDVEEIKSMLITKGVKINESAIPSQLRSALSDEEMVKMEKPVYSFSTLQELPYEKLIRQEDEIRRNTMLQKYVLDGAFRKKDWPVFEKVLKYMDVNSLNNIRLTYITAAYYARKEETIDKCIHLVDKIVAKAENGKVQVDIVPLNQILNGLCALGHHKVACQLLQSVEVKAPRTNSRVGSPPKLFDMTPSPENTQLARNFMEVMKSGNYLQMFNNLTVFKSYWEYLVKTEDMGLIYNGFDELHNHHAYIPTLTSVFCNLVKADDKANLQAAFDKFSELVPEQHELVYLAAAFFECDIKDKAQKVLATPGLRIDKMTVDRVLNEWIQAKKYTLAENFCKLVEHLPGTFTRAETIFCKLRILCNKENSDVQECINFFETQFEEEGIVPNIHATRYMANYLRNRNLPLPMSIQSAGNERDVNKKTVVDEQRKKENSTVAALRMKLKNEKLEDIINEEMKMYDKTMMFVAALLNGDQKKIKEVKEAMFPNEDAVWIRAACHLLIKQDRFLEETLWRNFVNAIDDKLEVCQNAISVLGQARNFDVLDKVYNIAKSNDLTMEKMAETKQLQSFNSLVVKVEKNYQKLERQLQWEPSSTWSYQPKTKQQKENKTTIDKENITEAASDVSEANSVDVITDNAVDISSEKESERIQDTAEIIKDKDGTDK